MAGRFSHHSHYDYSRASCFRREETGNPAVGNHSWISIDIITSQNEILRKITAFEKEHPELELYDVDIDWSSRKLIWLHHRQRAK